MAASVVRRIRRTRRSVAVVITSTLVGVAACSPGGLGYDELASEPVFTMAMPEATEIGTGGSDPRGNVEGGTYGYAIRMFVSDEDAAAVLAWHQAAYEADGWTPSRSSPITMRDGHFPEHAWQRGDLIIGFGFPDPDRLFGEQAVAAEAATTAYEVSIAYRPEATPASSR